MKKILFSGLLALGFGFTSTAQDGAAQVFERAKAAHGGAALEGMTSYRDAGFISYYDEKGQITAKIDYKQMYDFATQKFRLEVSQNKTLLQIQQVAPTEAWTWTSQSGVVRLPAAQAKPLRDSFSQGIFAFRAKTADLKDLKTLGTVKIAGIEGTQISFSLNGAVSKPVIAADGTILGGVDTLQGAEIQGISSDYRVINGVKVAFLSKSTVGGKPVFDLQVDTAEVNPAFTEADFARPK